MSDAYAWAAQSKDPRTKIGAILVHWDRKDPIIHAYNGLARGVDDNIPERWLSPEKHDWTSHAERNAIFLCARTGRATEGTTMFTQGMPCMQCCDGIINAGISGIRIHKPWLDHEKRIDAVKWEYRYYRSAKKLHEAGIGVGWCREVLGLTGLLDGELIKV